MARRRLRSVRVNSTEPASIYKIGERLETLRRERLSENLFQFVELQRIKWKSEREAEGARGRKGRAREYIVESVQRLAFWMRSDDSRASARLHAWFRV